MNRYKITVIMPALNEELNLAAGVDDVLKGFAGFNINGELIIVNDGSSDRTGAVAEELKSHYPFIQVIHHHVPQGIGFSFWEGVQKAEGEFVVMIPGDAENDAHEILRYLTLMEHVDIIVPYIYNPDIRNRRRRILSFLYRQIINTTFNMTFACVTGTVIYRKSILNDISLKSRGFFYQSELLIKTKRRGYLYAEVPYFLKRREAGESKSTTFRSLIQIMQSYLTTLFDVYFLGNKEKTITAESVTAERTRKLL